MLVLVKGISRIANFTNLFQSVVFLACGWYKFAYSVPIEVVSERTFHTFTILERVTSGITNCASLDDTAAIFQNEPRVAGLANLSTSIKSTTSCRNNLASTFFSKVVSKWAFNTFSILETRTSRIDRWSLSVLNTIFIFIQSISCITSLAYFSCSIKVTTSGWNHLTFIIPIKIKPKWTLSTFSSLKSCTTWITGFWFTLNTIIQIIKIVTWIACSTLLGICIEVLAWSRDHFTLFIWVKVVSYWTFRAFSIFEFWASCVYDCLGRANHTFVVRIEPVALIAGSAST